MKRPLSLIPLLLLIAFQSNAQAAFDNTQRLQAMYFVNANAKPRDPAQYANVEGDTYLTDDWIKGTVLLRGRVFKVLLVNFDIYNNELYFKNKDTDYTFILPVDE